MTKKLNLEITLDEINSLNFIFGFVQAKDVQDYKRVWKIYSGFMKKLNQELLKNEKKD